MKSPLHILHLKDEPHDVALAQSTLEAGGIAGAFTRVETRADFVAALEAGGIDLILSDFSLPTFDGLSALDIAHSRHPEVPFILVSGILIFGVVLTGAAFARWCLRPIKQNSILSH